MNINKQPHIFEDRIDAGRHLAKHTIAAVGPNAIILGIARGGIPIAASAADKMQMPWNVIVTRKLPIPWHVQSGFGAVAADGSVVINETLLSSLGMPQQCIDKVIYESTQGALQQAALYAEYRTPSEVRGRAVILVDDALISGYTMLAAIRSVRAQNAATVTVAAPVASRYAAALVESAADECAFDVISPSVPFSPLDFYLQYQQLRDEDIIPLLCPDRSSNWHEQD